MSYDLIFFNPKATPLDEDAFEDWLDALDESDDWAENEEICVLPLQQFYQELSLTFPSFENSKESDESYASEYAFSRDAIEANFAFSVVPELEKLVLKLIKKYKVGVYDSQDGEILR